MSKPRATVRHGSLSLPSLRRVASQPRGRADCASTASLQTKISATSHGETRRGGGDVAKLGTPQRPDAPYVSPPVFSKKSPNLWKSPRSPRTLPSSKGREMTIDGCQWGALHPTTSGACHLREDIYNRSRAYEERRTGKPSSSNSTTAFSTTNIKWLQPSHDLSVGPRGRLVDYLNHAIRTNGYDFPYGPDQRPSIRWTDERVPPDLRQLART